LPQKTQNKVICAKCKEIGSIYRKKDKIRIPQKSQIYDFNSLLDFCSVTWFLRYKQGLANLISYSDNIPSQHQIFENHAHYVKHVPFSIHSDAEISQFKEQIYSKIREDVDEISITRTNQDSSTEFTQEDILKGMMIAAYSYVSFNTLKRFNEYLEPSPITLSDKDLKEIVQEFYKSIQYMSLDRRRVYSPLEQAKSVIMNSNDNDFYYNLQPVYKDNEARCTDCKRRIPLDKQAGDDIRRYRCPYCFHPADPLSGRLTRIKPSASYRRDAISKQLKTLNRYSQAAHNIFKFIRNAYILECENTEEKYRSAFNECLSDFINGIGPPDFKLAVKHYVPTKRNNTPCYLKSEDDLMNTRILDREYLTALLEIFISCKEGNECPDRSKSIAERKLFNLKIPPVMVTKKVAIDLEWIDNILPPLIDDHICTTLKNALSNLRNEVPIDKVKYTLLSEVKDRGNLLTIYFNLILNALIKG
jgi:hypothetical protein